MQRCLAHARSARRVAAACVVALASATGLGCNVGPRYVPPKIGIPTAFRESSAAAYAQLPPGTWMPAAPDDAALKGEWWKVFREPELDALEAELDINNQTIAQSFQLFMAARAQIGEARAGYYPTFTTTPSVTQSGTRGGTSAGAGSAATSGTLAGAAGSVPSGASGAFLGSGSFFSIPGAASWAPDVWDRVRNTVREFQYAAQVSAADLANLRLTEEATLAEFYFQLRGQDALQQIYTETIKADQASLDYARGQSITGVGAELAAVQADVTLQNAQATAVGVATNRAIYEHAIATLIGKPASGFLLPVHTLTTPPPAIPLGVPSTILQRRPDVAAAERTMAQANALIGVEAAAYYPSFTLSASGGIASGALGTLFSAPSVFWSLAASAAETLFEGGLRDATMAEYTARYRADVAAYRQVVLTAFQQVEDYLATMRILSVQIARQDSAVKAAERYVAIATAQYQTGIGPYLDVITAQGLLLVDQQTLLTLRVNQLVAAVQLVQALGGGWDRPIVVKGR